MWYPTWMESDPGKRKGKRTRGYDAGEPTGVGELREAALAYDASPPPALRVVRGGQAADARVEKGGGKVKTSVYLEAGDVSRLSWLAGLEGRPQAEIIRDAIRGYQPRTVDRDFELFKVASTSQRTTNLTQDDIDRMMEGFGEDERP